jgi:NAD(P)-dependent dehydrogenase (short-subunit alcohol dehydrogenase family)
MTRRAGGILTRKKDKSTSYKQLFDLSGRVAVIVGAAGGLAGETCLGLAQFGATLFLADINPSGLQAISSRLKESGIEAWSEVVDVSKPSSVRNLMNAVSKRFGRLDIMINFAGMARPTPINEIDPAEYERIIDVNLKGSFFLAQHSLRLMLPQRSGKIILVGSVSGQIGRPFSVHYAASKGGVHSMVRTIAVEVAKQNVQINSVAPVFTLTPLSAGVLSNKGQKRSILATIPMGRLGLPSDLVGAMIFLSSNASSFITGQTIFVDGGCTIS